ncbi:hypothetical protein NMY22_g15930 [Coprinellus aureogranulatus]|nr:hypothetical protein NMY22_g15930 [Coprinellus aureogranulatus]
MNYPVGPLKARLNAGTSLDALLFRYSPDSPEIISTVDAIIRFISLTPGLEQTERRRYELIQGLSAVEKISLEEEARIHINLTQEELLDNVQSLPGLESFLLPPSCSKLLRSVPEDGPVVIVNVYERRCDAIALVCGLDVPIHMPLPTFSLDKANKHRANLSTQLSSHGLRMRSEYAEDKEGEIPARALGRYRRKEGEENVVVKNALRSLWLDVVKPVLVSLAISKPHKASSYSFPRIWWFPTGPLTFLPLHASGIYEDDMSKSLLDYAISSYVLAVSVVTDKRKHAELST